MRVHRRFPTSKQTSTRRFFSYVFSFPGNACKETVLPETGYGVGAHRPGHVRGERRRSGVAPGHRRASGRVGEVGAVARAARHLAGGTAVAGPAAGDGSPEPRLPSATRRGEKGSTPGRAHEQGDFAGGSAMVVAFAIARGGS